MSNFNFAPWRILEKLFLFSLFIMLFFKKISLLLLFPCTLLQAQENLHPQSGTYEWPKDPLVKQKLEQWRDSKFGMIIHWGLYAVPGIVESWQLCSEDWVERDSNIAYADFKKWYWGLIKYFNPVHFNPTGIRNTTGGRNTPRLIETIIMISVNIPRAGRSSRILRITNSVS